MCGLTMPTPPHDLYPVRTRQVLVGVFFAAISFGLWPPVLLLTLPEMLRLLCALLSAAIAAWVAFLMVLRLPRVTWCAESISETSRTSRCKVTYRLTEYGPVMPLVWRGRNNAVLGNFLVFRPLAGGKVGMICLPDTSLSEVQLIALSQEINRTRSLPPGCSDPEAVNEASYEMVMASAPVFFVAYIYLPILVGLGILLAAALRN